MARVCQAAQRPEPLVKFLREAGAVDGVQAEQDLHEGDELLELWPQAERLDEASEGAQTRGCAEHRTWRTMVKPREQSSDLELVDGQSLRAKNHD